jgi:hypothetical protein
MEETEKNGTQSWDKVRSTVRKIPATWKAIERGLEAWDLEKCAGKGKTLGTLARDLDANVEGAEKTLQETISNLRIRIHEASYPKELKEALEKAGVPLQGEFPEFVFPPFRLKVMVEEESCSLNMGRRRERITAMNPAVIAQWAAKRYRQVASRPVNAAILCQDLMEAYEVVNRLHFGQRDVLWGKAVPLDKLYKILTLRRESKREYPKPLFVFDLARLKEQFEITHKGFRFEFGFTRDQGSSIDLVDSQGRVSHISSLSIHSAKTSDANTKD